MSAPSAGTPCTFWIPAQMTIHLPSKQDRLQRANRVPQTRVAVLEARMHTFD